jgi:molybdopterin-guanine dinucleotide biosynthesis protein A
MITGLILAGGSGTRLGEFKPLAPFGDRTLIEHVAGLLRQVVDEVVVSVALGTSDRYDGIFDDARIVEDRERDRGPLEGLAAGLRAAAGEYTLVSPCDTPFLAEGVCRLVIRTAMGTDGAVPFVRGYFEPLHGAYKTSTCARAFDESLSEGKRKPKDAYEKLDIAPVYEGLLREIDPELRSFWNINSREDLERARAHLGSR